MDTGEERARVLAERAEILSLLRAAEAAGPRHREADNEPGDPADRAQPMVAEGSDDTVAASLRERLAVLDGALHRLGGETPGRSVGSGQPIGCERPDTGPAARLAVDEARARR
jgi:RNA polymerase-binding transcription factor DksA